MASKIESEIWSHILSGCPIDTDSEVNIKGDPIEAVRILAPWIKHVHVKDAVKTSVPGEWGTEVPWGDGEVGCDRFIQALDEIGYAGALAIEREGGESRGEDIKLAADRLGAMA